MDPLKLVLSSMTLALGIAFIVYVAMILGSYLREAHLPVGDPLAFDWHIFIPCRDEGAVIGQTLERARAEFPAAHVWVVDDDSDDDTAAIVRSRMSSDARVHLVSRCRPYARTGKGDALNAAYRELISFLPSSVDPARVIVCVLDADGEMEANAFEVVAGARVFGDSMIGAAQIAVWMKNRADRRPYPERGVIANAFARWLIRMQDLEFRTVIAGMQSLRQRVGTVGLGGNGQFARLSALQTIAQHYGEPWHGALLEDYELGVHMMLAGYTTRHVYDTHVNQEALPSLRRLLTQRTRWAQGNIQCVRYIPTLVRSENVSSSGLIETCYYLVLPFLQILGLVAFLWLVGFGAWTTFHQPVWLIDASVVPMLLALNLLFAVAPFAIWGPVYKRRCEPGISTPRSLLYGLGMWLYTYYMYVCIVRAFLRIIRGRNGWSKTRRNAEAHVRIGGSVAVED